MKDTIKAALQGPELQDANLNGHHFHIKPASIRIYNDEVTVFGQLSHRLALRDDDQVWYTFRKKGTTISPSDTAKMIVKLQNGGIIATIQHLKGIVGAISSYVFGVSADSFFDQINKLSGDLGFIDFDGDWQKQVNLFLTELSASVTIPTVPAVNGVKLYQDYNMTGNTTTIKVDQNVANAGDMGWNDKASSFYAIVPEGKKVTLFQHANYQGMTLEFAAGSHIVHDLNIHNFNDGTSSIRWDKA